MGADTNKDWFERAQIVLPGGVNSPVRSFASVGGTPFTTERAQGPYLFDVEGNRYLDLVSSYGAILLGHADERVNAAAVSALTRGSSFATPSKGEVILAERICELVGTEQVRFVSSGTEATMSALRLARAATGRSRIIKFAGCYHGHCDSLLVAGGSGVATLGIAGSAGVTDGAIADTIVAPYNVVPAIGPDIAAVIVEPVAANMNLIAPSAGFLQGLRAACSAAGALLIFDEVITGFRLGLGGAAAFFGVTPDLRCFGKVIGGGFPIGAFAGSRQLLSELAPLGPVYQAGTLSGNPVATAAGAAVLAALDDEVYAELTGRAAQFAADLEKALVAGGLAARTHAVGPLVGLLAGCGDGPLPANYDDMSAALDRDTYRALFHALCERGVFIAPGPFEVLFPGLAHTQEHLAQIVDLAYEAAVSIN